MKREKKKYAGVLNGFFETGTEGTMWVLETGNKKDGYNGEVFIEPDDYLTVYNTDGSIIFQGKICPDYKTGWRNYSHSKKYGQQCALGFWIHWIQKGWKPDDWATLFIKHWFKKFENTKQLRAKLIRTIVFRKCTKKNPWTPSKIKPNEHWEHEGAYEVDPAYPGDILLFECPNCKIKFSMDCR